MEVNKLTSEEFLQTFQAPMQNVTETAEPQIDIWPYVEAVPSEDLEGHTLLNGCVEFVYRDAGDKFDQLLIPTETADIFLAVVVRLNKIEITGHHLLNLPVLYGTA
jgi:hypothetical protein